MPSLYFSTTFLRPAQSIPACLMLETPLPSLPQTLTTLPALAVSPGRRVPPPSSAACNPPPSVHLPSKRDDKTSPPSYWHWYRVPPCQRYQSARPVPPGVGPVAVKPRAHYQRRKTPQATGRSTETIWYCLLPRDYCHHVTYHGIHHHAKMVVERGSSWVTPYDPWKGSL